MCPAPGALLRNPSPPPKAAIRAPPPPLPPCLGFWGAPPVLGFWRPRPDGAPQKPRQSPFYPATRTAFTSCGQSCPVLFPAKADCVRSPLCSGHGSRLPRPMQGGRFQKASRAGGWWSAGLSRPVLSGLRGPLIAVRSLRARPAPASYVHQADGFYSVRAVMPRAFSGKSGLHAQFTFAQDTDR